MRLARGTVVDERVAGTIFRDSWDSRAFALFWIHCEGVLFHYYLLHNSNRGIKSQNCAKPLAENLFKVSESVINVNSAMPIAAQVLR